MEKNEITQEKTIYTVTGTGTGRKASKKVEKLVEFIKQEFSRPGINLGYSKFLERFAEWNDNNLTVNAASMDLHKDINTACYIIAKEIFTNGNGEAVIPAMVTTKEGKVVICTKKASEFENVFYDNIDAEQAAAEKKAKKEQEKKEQEKKEQEKKEQLSESDAVCVDFDAITAKGANVTSILLNLIEKYGDKIDYKALQNAIDEKTLKAADVFNVEVVDVA